MALHCGIGIGVEQVTIDTYIAELAPPRGAAGPSPMPSSSQFAVIPVVAFLGWLLVPRTVFGLDGWRFVVMAGSVGAVLAWFVRAACRKARAGWRSMAAARKPKRSSRPGKWKHG